MDDNEEYYHPDVIPDAGVPSLYCFLQADRVCSAECMAYTTYPKASKSTELNQQQQHCSLLMSADRVGRNLTILAFTLSEQHKANKVSAQDRKREENTPRAPGPFGTQANINPFGKGK